MTQMVTIVIRRPRPSLLKRLIKKCGEVLLDPVPVVSQKEIRCVCEFPKVPELGTKLSIIMPVPHPKNRKSWVTVTVDEIEYWIEMKKDYWKIDIEHVTISAVAELSDFEALQSSQLQLAEILSHQKAA